MRSNPALRTPHYYGQFALSLGKESPYIFSKFNLVNADTFYGPSVSVSTGYDGNNSDIIKIFSRLHIMTTRTATITKTATTTTMTTRKTTRLKTYDDYNDHKQRDSHDDQDRHKDNKYHNNLNDLNHYKLSWLRELCSLRPLCWLG